MSAVFENFIVGVVIADISAGLHQRLQIIYTIYRCSQINIHFFSNCDKIDVCYVTCSRIQSAMQNLQEVITEYKEVALRRDFVDSSGKSLSSNNTVSPRYGGP